jgi:hypothetical protein
LGKGFSQFVSYYQYKATFVITRQKTVITNMRIAVHRYETQGCGPASRWQIRTNAIQIQGRFCQGQAHLSK